MRFDERNRFLGEICNRCRPEEFAEPFHEAGHLKIWNGVDAFPKQYKLGSDGIYHMTDEAAQDLASKWDAGPQTRLEESKRANRRTTPLTEEEIARANEWGHTHLKERMHQSIN